MTRKYAATDMIVSKITRELYVILVYQIANLIKMDHFLRIYKLLNLQKNRQPE